MNEIVVWNVLFIIAVAVDILLALVVARLAAENRKLRLAAESIAPSTKEESAGTPAEPTGTTIESSADEAKGDADETAENTDETAETGDEEAAAEPEKRELRQEDVDAFRQRLREICEVRKLYTDEDMTREDIIREMKTNRTYFSLYLKAATGMQFHEYLNSLRINYAKKLLEDPRVQLDDIPFMCGYKHKSTYYRAFVARFGCKPSEYRAKAFADDDE